MKTVSLAFLLLAVPAAAAFAQPTLPGPCVEVRRINASTVELFNPCVAPLIQSLADDANRRSHQRYLSRQAQQRVALQQWLAARRASPSAQTRLRTASFSHRSDQPILFQEVPRRPPTQAELEALVLSGPEPGKTWGVPYLPSVPGRR